MHLYAESYKTAMQLTRFTDYTLRVLISVGLNDKRRQKRGVTIGEISAQYDVSRNHLMKVVQHLARAGYLETLRGKGGGLRLARPASEINLGGVVRDVEGAFHVVPCFDEERQNRCVIVPACVLRDVLGKALSAFLGVLDGYTLEDLLGPDRRLAELLSAGAAGAAAAPAPPRAAKRVRV